jgi:hypothetical protein
MRHFQKKSVIPIKIFFSHGSQAQKVQNFWKVSETFCPIITLLLNAFEVRDKLVGRTIARVPKMGHGMSKSLRFLGPGALENLLLQMAGMCFNRGPSQAIQRRSFRTQNFDPGQVVRHQMAWSSSQHIAAIRLVRQPAQTIFQTEEGVQK